MKKIVFTGGGTGGHIMPNLSIIEKLVDKYEIYYLGSSGMEREIISKQKNIKFIEIPAVKLERRLTPKNLLIPFKLLKSIGICKKILKNISPCLIFSKGGYVSIPVCVAGNKLDIPIITHESDLTIGLANKIIARKSKYLCCSFKETAINYGKNAIHTGSPIRSKIFSGDKNKIKEISKFDKTKPIIMITGGSLGAQSINKFIWNNINSLTEKYSIIHLVGKNKINNSIHNSNNYIQIDFTDSIENYFDLSDIVITRAGSNTIFELLSIYKPMLLIPLSKKASRGDQILNAENFHKNGFAEYILEEELSLNLFINKIDSTLKNKLKYINNMKKNNIGNGTDNITELIENTTK